MDLDYARTVHWTLVVVGGAIILVAGHNAWLCARAALWPTVAGEITRSGVDDQTIDDSDGNTRTRYKPGLRYRYAVKGKQYLGDRVSFGYEWHPFRWTAQRVADRYPPGRRVRVHVSPSDPSESSLESGVTLASVGAFAGGIAFIATAFLFK